MLAYRDGPRAMDGLTTAFGFRERIRWVGDDGVLSHGEMATDQGLVMLATPTPDYEGPLQHRSHCEQARAAGAILLSDIETGPEDSRLYRVEDLEGHRWMFMQQVV